MHPGDEGYEWLQDGMNAMRGSYERPMSPPSCQASNPPTWQHAKLITTYPLHVQVYPGISTSARSPSSAGVILKLMGVNVKSMRGYPESQFLVKGVPKHSETTVAWPPITQNEILCTLGLKLAQTGQY